MRAKESLKQRSRYFFAFRAGEPFFRTAQRAFIAAASFALPSGVIPPFFFGAFDLEAD